MQIWVKIVLAALVLLRLGSTEDQFPISAAASFPLGFGTWNLKISSSNTSVAISAALQVGYRHLDCAAIYGNEKDVGEGIKHGLQKTGLKRDDVWITSKLWNDQ